jgi:hypothetical protein
MASTSEFTSVKTRTGTEIHVVFDMQPTTLCGRYLRYRPEQMQVSEAATCAKCLVSKSQMEAR